MAFVVLLNLFYEKKKKKATPVPHIFSPLILVKAVVFSL